MALIDLYSKEELKTIVENSYSIAEIIRKLGYSTNAGNNNQTIKSRIKEYEIDTSHFRHQNCTKRSPENIFVENSTAKQSVLRRQYKKGNYSQYVCSICGLLPEQNDKPLTLILDHINGNNKDDRLENLRWVCPNCNQQLDTTGYKNPNRVVSARRVYERRTAEKKICPRCGSSMSYNADMCKSCWEVEKKSKKKPSRDILKSLIRTKGFMEIGDEYGVTDRAVAKWCRSEGLPYRMTDIKKIPDEEWEKL